MKGNIVWIATQDVDLGVSIEGVFSNEVDAAKMVAAGNASAKVSWIGDDGCSYTSADSWHVEKWVVA